MWTISVTWTRHGHPETLVFTGLVLLVHVVHVIFKKYICLHYPQPLLHMIYNPESFYPSWTMDQLDHMDQK